MVRASLEASLTRAKAALTQEAVDRYCAIVDLDPMSVGEFREWFEDDTWEGLTQLLWVEQEEPNEGKATPWEYRAQVLNVADSHEEELGDATRRALYKDMRAILAMLSEVREKSLHLKASLDWQTFGELYRKYLLEKAGDNWREEFLPGIRAVIRGQADVLQSTLGARFNVANLDAAEWFNDYTMTFAQPINQTTHDGLALMQKHAIVEGWSVKMMQDRLTTLFEQWMDGDKTREDFTWYEERMPEYRRELIARDQTMRASHAGSYHLMREWGVQRKTWLASIDGRERPEHAQAMYEYSEGGVPGPIPMDAPFKVGGAEVGFPGDDSRGAPLEMVIQCRCVMLPYGITERERITEGSKAAGPPNSTEGRVNKDAVFGRREQMYMPLDYERMCAMGSDGRVVTERAGEATQVQLTPEELRGLAGGYILHNHPSGRGLSTSDVTMALHYRVKEMRVSGQDAAGQKWRYSFTNNMQDRGLSAEDNRNIAEIIVGSRGLVKRQDIKAILSGEMTFSEANANHWHKVWSMATRAMRKIGYDVSYRRLSLE